jgi:excisionase family DNA binding protein
VPDTSISPITVSVKDAAAITGLSKWTIYKRLDDKSIESLYEGSRRLVVVESLRRYIASLPTERPEVSA